MIMSQVCRSMILTRRLNPLGRASGLIGLTGGFESLNRRRSATRME